MPQDQETQEKGHWNTNKVTQVDKDRLRNAMALNAGNSVVGKVTLFAIVVTQDVPQVQHDTRQISCQAH